MYLPGHIFLVLAIFSATASHGKCQTLGSLPSAVIADIVTILINGTVHVIGNCTGSNDGAPQTNYWIYTRDNQNTPTVVTAPSADMCGGRTQIIFIAHGWSWDASAFFIVGLVQTYLGRYDACIISVNWGAYALQNYQSAFCAAPGVATNVANFACNLQTILGVPLPTIHFVGHSMGAQIFGMTGSNTQSTCASTIGRITGLDPAGPLYTGTNTNSRLDPTDATFVDVIHTNEGQYGYVGSCGDVDAFPNCGYFQPGCLQQVITSATNITTILNIPLDDVSCNHRRSVYYFQESINSDQFMAHTCETCGIPVCVANCFSSFKVIGEDCTIEPPGNYVLSTNSQSPYAQGAISFLSCILDL